MDEDNDKTQKCTPFHLLDIRGNYPKDVNEDFAHILASAVISCFSPKIIVLGRDLRFGSLNLLKQLTDTFSKSGITVINIGSCSTPQFYFSSINQNADFGIMVTASHLPPDQNGFKLIKHQAKPLNETEVKSLKNCFLKYTNFKQTTSIKKRLLSIVRLDKPKIRYIDTSEKYIEKLISLAPKIDRKIKVVIDTRNASATSTAELLFQKLPINAAILDVIKKDRLIKSLDPLNSESQIDIKRYIQENNADLGIIIDGDGDRVLFINKNGDYINNNIIVSLVVKSLLNKNPQSSFVFDARMGLMPKNIIKDNGGKYFTVQSWAQNLKYAMLENKDILFGAESSGHYVFRDFFPIDDGLRMALFVIGLLATENSDFYPKIRELQSLYFNTPERNYKIKEDASYILSKIADYFRQKDCEVSLLDGVSVTGDSFFFNLRPSLSEPLLRLNIESTNLKIAESILEEVSSLIGTNFE